MATYSKETALYDTGAIAGDIEEAGKTADRYITAVDQSGIKVHAQNNPNINYSKIDANGLEVFKGTTTANSTSVAKFGDTARIGKEASSHFNINASSLQAYDSSNNKYFEVSSSGITYGSNTVASTSYVGTEINGVHSYALDSSCSAVEYDKNGADPSSITVSAKYSSGKGDPTEYSGRFKIETTTNNSTWTTTYTSSANESSKTFNAPTNVVDKVPYNFRVVPSGVGDVLSDELVGGSIAWNQLERMNRATETNATVLCTNNGDGSFTLNGTASANSMCLPSNTGTSTVAVVGHKYLAFSTIKNPSINGLSLGVYINGTPLSLTGRSATVYSAASAEKIQIGYRFASGTVLSSEKVYGGLHDLTQMFGSTIADYIYSLEQANAGAGVAWFRKLFPKPYYAYDAGTLKHVSGLTSHDTVGFNQFDKSTATVGTAIKWDTGDMVGWSNNALSSSDYISVLPSTTYYFKLIRMGSSTAGMAWYDADKNFLWGIRFNATTNLGKLSTPAEARYCRISFNTEDIDTICVNIARDDSRNGEYEPYVKHSYLLDNDLVLRGILKLDADNKLYYDGDIYESDGTVTRKYGIVDLGTLTWGTSSNSRFVAPISDMYVSPNNNTMPKAIMSSSKYEPKTGDTYNTLDYSYYISTDGKIAVKDVSISGATAFTTAMSGVYLVYELATPTTETADPFASLQVCDPYGTEEYIDTRDVAVPVGHNTTYISGVKAIRASLYKAGGTSTLLAQRIIPCGQDVGTQAVNIANESMDVANESAKTATNYITYINASDGIKVHNASDTTNYAQLNSNGMTVVKGGTDVAQFGTDVRIGKANYGHVEIDDTGMVVKGNQDGSALSGSDEHSYIASTAAFIGAESNLAHIDMGGARSLIYSTQSGQTVGDRYHGTEIITDTEGAYFTADYATTSIQARKQNKLANVTVDIDASNDSHINMVADSIQMNGNSIADFVTEQGTSSIWTYRVWNSGIKECWGAYTASIAVTTSSPGYGGYRSGSLNIPTFPVTFTSAPTVTATVGSAGGVWVNNVHTITTTGGSFYLSAGASSAATNRTIYFHVIGK